MSREEEIKKIRIEKIKRLEEAGYKAYVNPEKVKQDLTLFEVLENFSDLEKNKEKKNLVGRILVKRGAGKISFVKFTDGTEDFQAVLKEDVLSKEKMKEFEKLFDMGDFAGFYGSFFKTEKGQESILVEDFSMLTKSLLPLPEKWHGLEDIEEKYRKRYLDLISDKNSYNRFILRAKVIKKIKEFLDSENFLEVETPILQNQASGTLAEAFKTFHKDLGIDMVLRIALEAEHKILMAGGYPGVYEIGKNFRNEGSDPTHIQEFTMLEWYRAYRGLSYNMDLTEKMLKEIAKEIFGKTNFTLKNEKGEKIEIDFAGDWPRKNFNDLVLEHGKTDLTSASREEKEKKALELGGDKNEISKISDGNLADFIYKKTARKKIINPTYVLNYPASLKPLAIEKKDGTAEVCQLVVGGAEITNQYGELVNPLKQREVLERQAEAKEGGDLEAMDMNEDFLTAMEHGMPPMTGTGIGIDRLVAIFTEQENLRDTIFFPILKPEKKEISQKEAEKKYREKKIIVISDESLGYGITANALCQLGISIGGFLDSNLIFGEKSFKDADGNNHRPDGLFGMSNLSGDQKQMAYFIEKCIEAKIEFFDFSEIMRKAHTDLEMKKGYADKKTSEVGYIAVGALVPKDFEKEFLSKLKLFGA